MARSVLNSLWHKSRSKIIAISAIVAACNANFAELYADKIVVFHLPLHASKTAYNIFIAEQSYTVNAVSYVPDVVQGSAITATVVKCTGTNAPVAATTPLHSGTINTNATINTVQNLTLTTTAADLSIVAGERLGVKLSGAMTAGSGLITIRMTAA